MNKFTKFSFKISNKIISSKWIGREMKPHFAVKKSPRASYWIFLGLKNVGFQVIGCGLIRGSYLDNHKKGAKT